MKIAISLILSMLITLSLCACNGQDADTSSGSDPDEIVIPSVIYGSWHSHPEIDSVPIEVNADGTCSIDGQQFTWKAESVETDKVVLVAGEDENEITLTFSQLTFPVPLLAVTSFGVFIQQDTLWMYVTEWYNPDTDDTFSLSFYELAQSGCKLTIDGSNMTVEVIDDDAVTYTIQFSGGQAVVTDTEGNSATYEPMN